MQSPSLDPTQELVLLEKSRKPKILKQNPKPYIPLESKFCFVVCAEVVHRLFQGDQEAKPPVPFGL